MKIIKKTLSILLIIYLIAGVTFFTFESAVTKAQISDTIVVTAEVTDEISIGTPPADVLLASSIPGISGNPGAPASGSATWTVKTSNTTGFNMKIKATQEPAMQLDNDYMFANYTPAAAGSPDAVWSVPVSGSAEFGYTVEPATAGDTDTLFLDDGAGNCGTGLLNTADTCWYNFSTSDANVIYRTTATDINGQAEVVKFRAESNAAYLKEGYYDAQLIATFTMN